MSNPQQKPQKQNNRKPPPPHDQRWNPGQGMNNQARNTDPMGNPTPNNYSNYQNYNGGRGPNNNPNNTNQQTKDKPEQTKHWNKNHQMNNGAPNQPSNGKPNHNGQPKHLKDRGQHPQMNATHNHSFNHEEKQNHSEKAPNFKKLQMNSKREKGVLQSDESHQFSGDSSSISTNISMNASSDRPMRNGEGTSSGKIRLQSALQQDPRNSYKPNPIFPQPQVLFQVAIKNGMEVNSILVWDNEESYEKFLEEVCMNHKIGGSMALYFKINLLKMIQKAKPNHKEVEELLSRLLDLNFNLLYNEMENLEKAYQKF